MSAASVAGTVAEMDRRGWLREVRRSNRRLRNSGHVPTGKPPLGLVLLAVLLTVVLPACPVAVGLVAEMVSK